MSFQTTNPTNNKLIKSFEEITNEALENAVAKAANTYEE